MTSEPEVLVQPDADSLAGYVGERACAALALALDAREAAHLVVTGGSILEPTLAALVPASEQVDVDWSRVHVWWGDERYVPHDSPDRNEIPARQKAFDKLPLRPENIHAMPASDAGFASLDDAATAYAEALAEASHPDDSIDSSVDTPRFDVVLLGLGPDGHCASMFPHTEPGVLTRDVSVIAVRESSKPPPERLSLTVPALDAAEEIWFVAAGEGKAHAVGRALGGADPIDVPSAAPKGRNRTIWFLDEAAAAEVPASVPRLEH